MDNLTRKDLFELKEAIISALKNEEEKIISFSKEGRDEDFDNLIKKAVYYRNLLKQIEQQLSKI